MRKLLIATHGRLASGFKSSLELFIADSSAIKTIDAYVDEDNKDFTKEIEAFIDSIQPDDEGIIFTDIEGGSVNQKVFQLCYGIDKNVFIITGVNLSAIMGILLHPVKITSEEINKLLDDCKVKLVSTEKVDGNSIADNDDFL